MKTPSMTLGQFKQLTGKLIQSVPQDIGFEDAEHLITSGELRFHLDKLWNQFRTTREYTIPVPESALKALEDNEFIFVNKDQSRDIYAAYFEQVEVSTEASEVRVSLFRFTDLAPVEIRRHLKALGYRSADPRELVGFLLKYPDYVNRYANSNLSVVPVHPDFFFSAWFNDDEGRTDFTLDLVKKEDVELLADMNIVHQEEMRQEFTKPRLVLVVKL